MSLNYQEESDEQETNRILIGVWVYLLGLIFYGLFGFYQLVVANPEIGEIISELFQVSKNFLSENWLFIVTTIVVLFLLIIVISVIQIYLLSFIGAELVVGVVFGLPILLIGVGVFTLNSFGVFLLVPGLIIGTIVYYFRKRIIFGANFFEFSTEVVLQNLHTLTPMIIVAFLNMIFGFLYFGAATYTYFLFYSEENQIISNVSIALVSLAYIVGQSMIRYFAEAVNVSIFFRWYRNMPNKGIKDGLNDVMQVKTTVLAFGGLMGFVSWLRRMLREQRQKTGRGGGAAIVAVVIRSVLFASEFMLRIFEFLTYYTLPVIVIEKKSLGKSVERSGRVVSHTLGSVISGNLGMGIASFLYNLFNFIILLSIGAWFGYGYTYNQLLANSVLDENSARIGMAILMAIIFLIFGFYPMSILFTPIRTAFSTLLFLFIADREDDKAPPPEKVPVDIREQLEGLFIQDKFVQAREKGNTRYDEIFVHGGKSIVQEPVYLQPKQISKQNSSQPELAPCLKCGKKNKAGASFCENCGVEI